MKKYLVIFFIFIAFLILLIFVILSPKINEDEVLDAVDSYLLFTDNIPKKTDKCFTNSEFYGYNIRKLNEINVYVWSLMECYTKEKNKLVLSSGSSIPYNFNLKIENGNYIVINHHAPRDGNLYDKDMKLLFPYDVRQKMDNIQKNGTIDELKADIRRQVKEENK